MTDAHPLPERPRLSRRLNLLRLDAERYVLQSLTESIVMGPEQQVFLDLVPLLVGEHDLRSLSAKLPGYGPAVIQQALVRMNQLGLLEPTEPRSESQELDGPLAERYAEQRTLFSHLAGPQLERPDGVESPADLQQVLLESQLIVDGAGRLGSALVRALAQAGVGSIGVVDQGRVDPGAKEAGAFYDLAEGGPDQQRGQAVVAAAAGLDAAGGVTAFESVSAALAEWPEALVVLAADAYQPSRFQRINRLAQAAGFRWTSVRSMGFELTLGPTVLPGTTGCFECYRGRMLANAPSAVAFTALQDFLEENPWRAGHLNFPVGVGLASYELLSIMCQFDRPKTIGHVFTFSLLSFESRLDPVLRLPGCAACGASTRNQPGQMLWEKDVPR